MTARRVRDRHRHRRHLHRCGRRRRGHRRDRDDEDAVDTARPGHRVHGRRREGARPARARAGGAFGGVARHDGRHQQAPRGQGREPRLHHDRGLRAGARNRPPVGARRLRQLLLLGEARPDRAGASRARRWVVGWPSTAARSGLSTRRRPLPQPSFSATRTSAASVSAFCTRTPTPSTSSPCAMCSPRCAPTSWCRSPRTCCASTASTSGR